MDYMMQNTFILLFLLSLITYVLPEKVSAGSSSATSSVEIAKAEPAAVKIIDPVYTPPKGKALLLHPKARPAWCPEWAHICMSGEDTENGLVIQKAAWDWMTPQKKYDLKKGAPNEAGAPCTSKFFPESDGKKNPGKIVRFVKKGKTNTKCQPLPLADDGSVMDSFRIVFEPGKRHPVGAHVWARDVSVVIAGPTEDSKPVLVPYEGRAKAVTGKEGNGVIAMRGASGLTVANIDIEQSKKLPNGSWKFASCKSCNYRCIEPTPGKLVVYNVRAFGCQMGIQSGDGTEWLLDRVSMEHCNSSGILAHCVYSPKGSTLLQITNSDLSADSAHVVKSLSRSLVVKHSKLVEVGGAKVSTGVAVDDGYGGYVLLEDVEIIQGDAPKGNPSIFLAGDKHDNRCIGVDGVRGKWSMKNVHITDEEKRLPGRRLYTVKTGCPELGDTQFFDLGGNSYNGKPLRFSDGKPVFE